MRYRNKKTGIIIKPFGKVSGGDWEPIEEQNPVPEPEKSDHSENQTKDEPIEEETPAEEPSVPKPKTSRKGKK